MKTTSIPVIGGLLKTSGWGAIAAALAMMTMPAQASAEAPGRGSWRSTQGAVQTQGRAGGWRGNSDAGSWRSHQGSVQSQRGGDRSWRGNANSSNTTRWRGNSAAAQTQSRTTGNWQSKRWPSQVQQQAQPQGRQQARPQVREQTRPQVRQQAQPHVPNGWTVRTPPDGTTSNESVGQYRSQRQADTTRDHRTYNRDDRSADWRRNRDSGDNDRDRTYRNSRRDNDWRNHGDSWRDSDRNWRSGSRYGYRGNYRDWNRNWRDNSRYDWRSYRSRYHDRYRLGRYYSPYRDWGYSRLRVGVYLAPLFYSSTYWLDDPWDYRLPPAYGPYRWVRYYDDALLVNIYTGEVVDAIYDFFW